MTFLSYAQNFEDVMLWRALGSVERGFYIDVGAAHPDIDSVTRAFYDRGWSGINVEPVADSARRIRAARLRDITLEVALGDTPGTMEFFEVEGTGLSTLEADALPAIDRAGFAVETKLVEITTLARVCADYAPAEVHFLKVDVEGFEPAVLRGADFTDFRPWVILVEATAPMSTEETHGAWEPIVLSAGYRFVYFDGLNRFYVADEQYDALASHFRVPPNVFDNFLRVSDTEFARRVAEAQTQAAEAKSQARDATRARAQALASSEENARLQQALLALQDEYLSAVHAGASARAEAEAALSWLEAMRASTSWRLSAPVRLAASLIQKARHRLAPAPQPVIAEAPAAEPAPPDPRPPLVTAAPDPPPPPPVPRAGHEALRHTVHQFHSGSATGDAITNAMLLTRTLLRRRGYASEIFVEHLDPLLADELRPLDELPLHADYVLIVRHSMGFGAFEQVAELPAPKVLIYHNITPPEFLRDTPLQQEMAVLGRDQLALWQPRVMGVLADSEYNAIELRRLGFDTAQACTLLFDIAALRGRGAIKSATLRTDAFTILFVGRVVASKAQDDLIAAYALFRSTFAGPSRLVLVGRHDGAGTAYFDAIQSRIAADDLDGHVILAGLVPDAALHDWYSAADLYVSVSRHEGFGVPLVEAMAYGIPVLALPTGAIPYTLAGTGELLADGDPETVAAAMRALAGDPARRKEIAERQRRSLDRFAIDRQMRPLRQALAQAGAAPPQDRAARALLEANLHVTITGHINGSYSLAAINRSLALTIEGQRPGKIRLLPVEGEPTVDLSGVPEAVHAAIARLSGRPKPETGPEMVISQHYPVLVPADPGDVSVALFFWEESRVQAETIALLERSFRGVLAPSRLVAKTLIDSGLSIPVCPVGHVPELEAFQRIRPRRLDDAAPFTFLHISSGFPRKGIDKLLAAYARAFSAADAVRLVIKVFPNPHNDVADQIRLLRADNPDLAEIVLIDADIAESALLDLYRDADAAVLPSRGEGFNIPAAEAMAAGIPLIVTGFGGHMDFCTPQNARLLDYRFAPSGSHLATPHSLWAEPDLDDLVAALCEGVANRSAGGARALAARKAVTALQDRAGFVRGLADAGISLLLARPRKAPRITWVSTWQVRCGIAGYSQSLLAAMPEGADITVLCETRTDPQTAGDGAMRVRRAWRLVDPESVPALATAVAAADPHVVIVQHQPGLLPWGALADLLTKRALQERAVVVTLHTTNHLGTVEPEERAAVLGALAGIARVIVHTVADLNYLKDLGLVGNVTMLPHGAPPRADAPPPRPLVPSGDALIGCYGFFLPGKGIGALIEAAATLRDTWPCLRLRLVNADYGTPDSATEIAACRALAERLGVPVEWHTEFLPNETSLELLAGCDIVALPYQASREASSAALRTALSAGGVVAVTPLSLFDEADDAVFRLPGTSADDIGTGLGELLDDMAMRIRIREAAARWLADRNWPDIATRLHGMLTGLAG